MKNPVKGANDLLIKNNCQIDATKQIKNREVTIIVYDKAIEKETVYDTNTGLQGCC